MSNGGSFTTQRLLSIIEGNSTNTCIRAFSLAFFMNTVVGICTLCQHFFEHFSEAKALSIIKLIFFPQNIEI